MYFDPTWIFENKPDKHQYPNITGLMDDKPKPPKKQKKPEVIESLADVFRPAELPFPKKIESIQPPAVNTIKSIPEDQTGGRVAYGQYIDEVKKTDPFRVPFQERTKPALEQIRKMRYGYDLNPELIKNHNIDTRSGSSDLRYFDYTGSEKPVKLIDNKYNIRNNVTIDPRAISELRNYIAENKLTPEQALLVAAISSNESEFGVTRDLFGANDLYKDFPKGAMYEPNSYEAKKLNEWYNGNAYHDLWNFLQRKTDNLTNLNKYNPYHDKEFGESYNDRIMKHVDILLSNPEFLKALFGGQVPQLDLSQFKSN